MSTWLAIVAIIGVVGLFGWAMYENFTRHTDWPGSGGRFE